MSPSRGALVTGAVLTVAAAATIAVVVWPEGSGTGLVSESSNPRTPAPAPSPTRSYPLSTAPRTIPAVREHIAARGPGWRPGKDSGVVVAHGSGTLGDEGQLLAKELKIHYRGEVPARAGDVELALTPGAGTPSRTPSTSTTDGPGSADPIRPGSSTGPAP